MTETASQGPDRLDPAARPLMETMAALFPDVGGAVTDPAEARRHLARSIPAPIREPAVGEVTDVRIPGPPGAPELPLRIYRPPYGGPAGERERPLPTVVFLHGGGWVLCSVDSHDAMVRSMCLASGAVVVSVDYRLAPEARFPGAAEDAYAAVLWAAEHIAELGGDPGALVVCGDSAGGNLAAVCALMARDRGGPRIAHQSLIYPSTDPSARTDSRRINAQGYYLTDHAMRWFGEQYFGPGGDLTHPYAAPLRAELSGLPPAHVVTAGCDPLCDEGRAYAAKLARAGVPVSEAHFPGMFHGFLGLGGLLPDALEAMTGLGEVIAATASDRKIAGGSGVSDG